MRARGGTTDEEFAKQKASGRDRLLAIEAWQHAIGDTRAIGAMAVWIALALSVRLLAEIDRHRKIEKRDPGPERDRDLD